MASYRYLIVGGGMTAAAAVEGIRSVDSTGPIGLISAEPERPYERPPLSKGLWKGEPEESIWHDLSPFTVDEIRGRTVVSIDAASRTVVDDTGTSYSYERLLLATGGTPRQLPNSSEAVIAYRTIADYRRLRSLVEHRQSFIVVGSGFIGSEIAAALTLTGKHVTLLVSGDAIGSRIYPADLAKNLTAYYREHGVTVRTGVRATAVTERDGRQVVSATDTINGQMVEFVADGVVAGLGITPNVDLALQAGALVDDGIVVDEQLRTSIPGVYAAGDVASFFNPSLGRLLRVEHADNAATMGRFAGVAMAGQHINYDHLPMFYSDLFDLGYEAVGDLDSRLETFSDWKEPFREGVVYYLKGGRVRGVLLWNVWDQVDHARALIADTTSYTPETLVGLLPR